MGKTFSGLGGTITVLSSGDTFAADDDADSQTKKLSAKVVKKYCNVDSTWIAPTLLNSWVLYSTNYNVAYKKVCGNIVIVRGLIKNGTTGSVFVLPSAYRPKYNYDTANICSQTSKTTRISVNSNGNFSLENYSTVWTGISCMFHATTG